MTLVLLVIGSVLILEGLALALAPSRIEQLLAYFSALSSDKRRRAGLAAVALGAVLIAIARALGLGLPPT